MQALRTIYRYWTALLFLAVVVQVGAAGYGAFNVASKEGAKKPPVNETTFDKGFNFHNAFGYLIFLGAVLLLLLALGSRLGKQRVLWALAVPILVAIQIVLAWAGESTAFAGIFHPVNALLIVALTGVLAHRAWRGERVAAVGSTPA